MSTPLPVTHLIHETREPVTALTQPHRHNGGTRLVLDQRGDVFRYDERELVPVGLRS